MLHNVLFRLVTRDHSKSSATIEDSSSYLMGSFSFMLFCYLEMNALQQIRHWFLKLDIGIFQQQF